MRNLHSFGKAAGIRADILTLAKGLGAGFPAGAIVSRTALGEPKGGLFGSTFGGGPLASAAVSVVCAAVREPAFRKNVEQVSAVIDGCAKVKGVTEMLGIGLLRGIRVQRPASEVKAKLLERGFIVGGSNDPQVIRLMPPLTLTVKQAAAFVDALAGVL